MKFKAISVSCGEALGGDILQVTFNKKDFRVVEKFGILASIPKEFLGLIRGIE